MENDLEPAKDLELQNNAWLWWFLEKYTYVIAITLAALIAAGVNIDFTLLEEGGTEYLEEQIKVIIGYRDLEPFSMEQVNQAVQDNPDFLPVYKDLARQYQSGKITADEYASLQYALVRELWRHFKVPIQISHLKNFYNSTIKTPEPNTSYGFLDLKADRITQPVYDLLPQELQNILVFDDSHGHVSAESLESAVGYPVVSAQTSVERGVQVWLAIMRANQQLLNQAAELGQWNRLEKVYVQAVMAASSDPGGYGFYLIDHPDEINQHMQTDVPQPIILFISEVLQSLETSSSIISPEPQLRTRYLQDIIRTTFTGTQT